MPHTLYGFTYSWNSLPVEDCGIFAQNLRTRGNLSTLTSNDGSWTLNLGNFEEPWQDEDLIRVNASLNGDTASRIAVVNLSAGSPQQVGDMVLVSTVRLIRGWNLV